VPEPGSTPDKPSRVVDGSPRAPRGLIIGALIATPLWAGLLLLARHLYASLR
jgi:hypothetical protein